MQNYAQLFSRAQLGMLAPEIQIETHVSNGLPNLVLVGMPETAVKESRDRVRSAIMSIGLQLPPKRITINLAPAELPKQGGRYDLSIALGILLATAQIQTHKNMAQFEWLGELGLNGDLRAVTGILPAVLAAKAQNKTLIVPADNLEEASLISGVTVLGAKHLLDVVAFLTQESASLLAPCVKERKRAQYELDLTDIRGQFQAKRVLEVCASGQHSLLMVGPPGSGKSMLASRLVTLLPDLTEQEAIEVATIESVAGSLRESSQFMQRKVVASHHSATLPAMIGGGSSRNQLKPGAITLAHNGILFLDELPEFNRNVLEALREPLETKQVEIARVNHQVTFPANALLVAAMNPSPSGYFADDPLGRCEDTPEQIARYLRKISGPLLDRIDCHLEVPALDYQALSAEKEPTAESSETVRKRVTQTQQVQLARQGCLNSALSVGQLQQMLKQNPLEAQAEKILAHAIERLGLSARAYHRILRLARTLADMAGAEAIELAHIAEAISYRSFDKVKR